MTVPRTRLIKISGDLYRTGDGAYSAERLPSGTFEVRGPGRWLVHAKNMHETKLLIQEHRGNS